jgi:CRP-like cAMP-binding protein
MTEPDSGDTSAWLSGPEGREFLAAGQRCSIRAESTLCQEGHSTNRCFLVTEGRFAITKRIEGKRYLLSIFGPGALLALMPALDGQPCAVTISAACDATVIEIGRERLRAALDRRSEQEPQIADRLSLLAIRRLRNATNELAQEICRTIGSPEPKGRIDAMRLARIQAHGYAWMDL